MRDSLFVKVGSWFEARATGYGVLALLMGAALAAAAASVQAIVR